MDNKVKKIPMRQCMGCNEHKPKNELLRVVRGTDGAVSLDFTGRKAGRGAYVCHDVKCLQKTKKSHRLDRVLECEIPESVYDAMIAELTDGQH